MKIPAPSGAGVSAVCFTASKYTIPIIEKFCKRQWSFLQEEKLEKHDKLAALSQCMYWKKKNRHMSKEGQSLEFIDCTVRPHFTPPTLESKFQSNNSLIGLSEKCNPAPGAGSRVLVVRCQVSNRSLMVTHQVKHYVTNMYTELPHSLIYLVLLLDYSIFTKSFLVKPIFHSSWCDRR